MTEQTIFDRRRKALISAMKAAKIGPSELADRIAPEDEEARDRWRLNLIAFRRQKYKRLGYEDAQAIAPHLDVQVARLIAGEMTDDEKQRFGGEVPSDDTPPAEQTAADKRAAQLKDRKALGSERTKALSHALGHGRTHSDLHQLLVADGKAWTAAQVRSYVAGQSFPNRDFLTDAAAVLNVDAHTLIIREHSLENLGRRQTAETQSPVAQPGSFEVSVSSSQLGIDHTDVITFDLKKQVFAGQTARIDETSGGYLLNISVPLGPGASTAMLQSALKRISQLQQDLDHVIRVDGDED